MFVFGKARPITSPVPPARPSYAHPSTIYSCLLGNPSLELARLLQGGCQAAAPACHVSCRKLYAASHDKSQQWDCRGRHSELGNARAEVTHANYIELPCPIHYDTALNLHVHMQIFGPWPYSTYMQFLIFKSLCLQL